MQDSYNTDMRAFTPGTWTRAFRLAHDAERSRARLRRPISTPEARADIVRLAVLESKAAIGMAMTLPWGHA